jgi:flagellar basal-body rod protein FlgB
LQPVYLFDLASRHANWASLRQATITSNIANANTPGFHASDVEPFTAILNKTHLSAARTSARHMDLGPDGLNPSKVSKSETWEVNESGNSVSIEQEMLKSGEVDRAFSLNTNIVRAFHRMMMASVKSS